MIFGFLGEASLEALKLTRCWESERKFETSEYQSHAEEFLRTSVVLFHHGKAAKVGLGKEMIDTLKSKDIVFIIDGQPKVCSCSEVDSLVDEQLALFKEWTHLLFRTVQAEVPGFEITNSMIILNLRSAGEKLRTRHAQGEKYNSLSLATGGEDSTEQSLHLQRIVKMLKSEDDDTEVSVQQLANDLDDVRPLAMKYIKESHAPHECWSLALDAKILTASKKYKNKFKYTKWLQPLVQRNSAWSLSTCAIEALIGDYHLLFPKMRKHAGAQRLIDECDILHGRELQIDDEEACKGAEVIFLDVYGTHRKCKRRFKFRCDSGSHKLVKFGTGSIIGFKRKRAIEIDAMAKEIEAVGFEEVQASQQPCHLVL